MLQVALDVPSLNEAKTIARKVRNFVDLIEVGTPLIKKEGMRSVESLSKLNKPVVADMKTMDLGYEEAAMAYEAGAYMTTVCGAASDETIRKARKAAKEYGCKLMVDLIACKDPVRRAKEVMRYADYVCFHLAVDLQTRKKLVDVLPRRLVGKAAVAGGINLRNIDEILKLKPEIVIVGSAITKSKFPDVIAKKLWVKIHGVARR